MFQEHSKPLAEHIIAPDSAVAFGTALAHFVRHAEFSGVGVGFQYRSPLRNGRRPLADDYGFLPRSQWSLRGFEHKPIPFSASP